MDEYTKHEISINNKKIIVVVNKLTGEAQTKQELSDLEKFIVEQQLKKDYKQSISVKQVEEYDLKPTPIPEGKIVTVQALNEKNEPISTEYFVVGQDYKAYKLDEKTQKTIEEYAKKYEGYEGYIKGGYLIFQKEIEEKKDEDKREVNTKQILENYRPQNLTPENFRYYLPLTEEQLKLKQQLTTANLQDFNKETLYLVELENNILTRGVFEELVAKEGFIGFFYDIEKKTQYAVYEKNVEIVLPEVKSEDIEKAINESLYDTLDNSKKAVVVANVLLSTEGFKYIAAKILRKEEVAKDIEREKFIEMITTDRLEYATKQAIRSLSSPIGMAATSYGLGNVIGRISQSALFGGEGFVFSMSVIGTASLLGSTYRVYKFMQEGKDVEALAQTLATGEAIFFGYLGYKSAVKTYSKTESEFEIKPYKSEGEKQIEIKVDTRPQQEATVKYTIVEHPTKTKAVLIREETAKQILTDFGMRRGFTMKRETILLFEKQNNEWILKATYDMPRLFIHKGKGKFEYIVKADIFKRNSFTTEQSFKIPPEPPTEPKTVKTEPTNVKETKIISASDVIQQKKDYGGGITTKQGQILIQKVETKIEPKVIQKVITPQLTRQKTKIVIPTLTKSELKQEQKKEMKIITPQQLLINEKEELETKQQQKQLIKIENKLQEITTTKITTLIKNDLDLKQKLDLKEKIAEKTRTLQIRDVINPPKEFRITKFSFDAATEKIKNVLNIKEKEISTYSPSVVAEVFDIRGKPEKYFFRPKRR